MFRFFEHSSGLSALGKHYGTLKRIGNMNRKHAKETQLKRPEERVTTKKREKEEFLKELDRIEREQKVCNWPLKA